MAMMTMTIPRKTSIEPIRFLVVTGWFMKGLLYKLSRLPFKNKTAMEQLALIENPDAIQIPKMLKFNLRLLD